MDNLAEILIEIMGWGGAVFFLVAYFLLVQKKWTTDQPIYHLFNILGGVMLVVNTLYYQAWAAAFINFAWGLIAVVGWWKTEK